MRFRLYLGTTSRGLGGIGVLFCTRSVQVTQVIQRKGNMDDQLQNSVFQMHQDAGMARDPGKVGTS